MKIGNKFLKIPLIQGGMGVGISLGNLAGSVMKEGAMGVISAAQPGYQHPDFLRRPLQANIEAIHQEVEKARKLALGQGLLGINIMVAGRQYEPIVKAACDAKVDAIISGAGLPLDLPKFASPEVLLAPIVSSRKALELICKVWLKRYQRRPDFIVVEGPLAGGHLGFKLEDLKQQTTQTLEEIIVDVKDYLISQDLAIPVFGAGGIISNQDVLDLMKIGADGVQVGSRFIATEECDAHPNFKQAIIDANPEDIVFIKSPSGYPGRGLATKFTNEFMGRDHHIQIARCVACLKTCNPKDTIYCITQALIDAVKGQIDQGVVFSGARAHLIEKMTTVKELISELMENTYENSFSL